MTILHLHKELDHRLRHRSSECYQENYRRARTLADWLCAGAVTGFICLLVYIVLRELIA